MVAATTALISAVLSFPVLQLVDSLDSGSPGVVTMSLISEAVNSPSKRSMAAPRTAYAEEWRDSSLGKPTLRPA